MPDVASPLNDPKDMQSAASRSDGIITFLIYGYMLCFAFKSFLRSALFPKSREVTRAFRERVYRECRAGGGIRRVWANGSSRQGIR